MADEHLAGTCGLYCGACTLYRARKDNDQVRLKGILDYMSRDRQVTMEDITCDGCLAHGRLGPYCRLCTIRPCAEKEHGVSRCADCPDFPCESVTAFNNDGVRHHAEALANVRRQQEVGLERWLREEEKRWRCDGCGVSLDWYARKCYRCGAEQLFRLPKLERDKK